MKRTKKIIGLIAILCFVMLLSSTSLAAKGSFSVSKTSVTLTEGGSTTFNITATNCEGQFAISSSDSSVVKVSSTSTWVNGSTTITLTAVKKGSAKITITASDVADNSAEPQPVTGSKTISVTVNAKSTGGSSSGGSSSGNSNTTTKTPSFKSTNQKVYTKSDCNLRASWSTSSVATPVKKGTELTLTGTSTGTIDGYTWYRVTYQGSTKYIASSLITYTAPKEDEKDNNDDKKDDKGNEDNKNEKSNNKNLSSLAIEGIEISPAFDKDITQYTAQVEGDVTELKIDAKAEHSKAKVTVEGNKNLKEGDNIIKVKVTAEDETTRTYFITVTQGEGTDVDEGLKLAELKIARVDFESTFRPDVHSYDLDLTSYVEKLDITAIPNQEDAIVEISGNENFKEGQNVIVILLTSADGNETANYQIRVNVPAEVIEQVEEPDTTFYILVGIAVAVVIIAVVLIIKRRRATDRGDFDEEEFFVEDKKQEEEEVGKRFSNYEDRYQLDNDDTTKEERRNRRADTLDDFLNAPEDDDDSRRPKGRHSR
ncbi:MAG: cadherin-like beta sandwich domain-containing protein [Clostridia bacterium]|nr:cadherin-like beta sandwich domain-containing protein [Clostridia bacterium]